MEALWGAAALCEESGGSLGVLWAPRARCQSLSYFSRLPWNLGLDSQMLETEVPLFYFPVQLSKLAFMGGPVLQRKSINIGTVDGPLNLCPHLVRTGL